MARPWTFETFVARAREVHGDKYVYKDWIKVAGVNVVVFDHPTRGELAQRANAHLAGLNVPVDVRIAAEEGTNCGRWIDLDRERERARALYGPKFSVTGKAKDSKGKSALAWRCEAGHHGITRQDVFMLGRAKCEECAAVDPFGPVIAELEKIHSGKYTYTNFRRINSTLHADAMCPIHGMWDIAVASHKRGEICYPCSRIIAAAKMTKSKEEWVSEFRQIHSDRYEYGELLSGGGSSAKIQVICARHGTFWQSCQGHNEGKGCRRCVDKITKPNREIAALLGQDSVEVILEHRVPGSKKTVDLYVAARNVAIEYNGNIWHSSYRVRSSDSHLAKLQQCQAAGIRLIQLFSDEWAYRREACQLLLRRACGVREDSVNARACVTRFLTEDLAAEFYNRWHIQGAPAKGHQHVGLVYADELCAVMSFSFNTSNRIEKVKDHKAELTRFATCKNVRGGFSKLMSFWLKENNEVFELVSYSDNRLFTGVMYEKCGFINDGQTGIDYTYLDRLTDKRLHKSRYQKSRLRLLMGDEYDDNKTELELTTQMKLYRVYDCGKTRWVWKK